MLYYINLRVQISYFVRRLRVYIVKSYRYLSPMYSAITTNHSSKFMKNKLLKMYLLTPCIQNVRITFYNIRHLICIWKV